MDQLSSRRRLAGVATAACCLTLAAATAAPALAGAAAHKHRVQSRVALVKIEKTKKYGALLADAAGRTLYYNSAETVKSLKCTGKCLRVWPPLLTHGKPKAGAGVVGKELGDAKRGASLQVTYHGHLLYLFSGDSAAGQANGVGIKALGGTWFALRSTGAPVKPATTTTTTSRSGYGGYGGTSSSSGSSGSGGSGGSSGSGGGW
jgi:predicted lipoprotein with Yx(FWY)xxD motif